MKLTPTLCPTCHSQTFVIWASNPPDSSNLRCPSCFADGKDVHHPFALYLGQPQAIDGAWHHREDVTFADIAMLIESSLWPTHGPPGEGVVMPEETFSELFRQLHDYVLDSTAIPHWRNQIEYIRTRIERDQPEREMVAELQARLAFLQWRIDETLVVRDAELALRQLWMLGRLKSMCSAWCCGEPFVEPAAKLIQVDWELLEPSGDGWQRILRYNDSLQSLNPARRDDRRLKLIWERGPDLVFVGRSRFDGYVVCVFDRAKCAVLESAFIGNALYVMNSDDWRELSKLSKSALMEQPREGVARHVHSERDWERRLFSILSRNGIRVPDPRA